MLFYLVCFLAGFLCFLAGFLEWETSPLSGYSLLSWLLEWETSPLRGYSWRRSASWRPHLCGVALLARLRWIRDLNRSWGCSCQELRWTLRFLGAAGRLGSSSSVVARLFPILALYSRIFDYPQDCDSHVPFFWNSLFKKGDLFQKERIHFDSTPVKQRC